MKRALAVETFGEKNGFLRVSTRYASNSARFTILTATSPFSFLMLEWQVSFSYFRVSVRFTAHCKSRKKVKRSIYSRFPRSLSWNDKFFISFFLVLQPRMFLQFSYLGLTNWCEFFKSVTSSNCFQKFESIFNSINSAWNLTYKKERSKTATSPPCIGHYTYYSNYNYFHQT